MVIRHLETPCVTHSPQCKLPVCGPLSPSRITRKRKLGKGGRSTIAVFKAKCLETIANNSLKLA